jgi:two-component system, sensor histidine kinase and response regulator
MSRPPLYSSRGGRDAVVLVVDDVERNLQLVGELLAAQRFEVLFASNGPAALERVAARPPDLILLDLMMPGMDGIEVCERLAADPVSMDIPVIFLTAAHDADLAVKALSNGAVDYITKPFHAPELLARVRTHVALKRARDDMRRIVEEKGELIGAVAHDLKNPISSVRFAALTLREQGFEARDPRRELVESIVDSCEDLLGLIRERLERNAREAEIARLQLGPIDLPEVLQMVLQQNRPAAHAKQIALTLEAELKTPLRARADYHALCEVVDNLVSNAVKFSPPGRPVIIAVGTGQHRRGTARIEVRDRGPGLSEEDRRDLFKPYQRLSARPTAGESSTGLGLSITKSLVEKMHGAIGCEPQGGGGTLFWVELPLAHEAQAGAESSAA